MDADLHAIGIGDFHTTGRLGAGLHPDKAARGGLLFTAFVFCNPIGKCAHFYIRLPAEFFPGYSALLPLFNQGKDRKSTRLNSSHVAISYAVFCLKKKDRKNATVMS